MKPCIQSVWLWSVVSWINQRVGFLRRGVLHQYPLIRLRYSHIHSYGSCRFLGCPGP